MSCSMPHSSGPWTSPSSACIPCDLKRSELRELQVELCAVEKAEDNFHLSALRNEHDELLRGLGSHCRPSGLTSR
ncbi:hypothetical protein J7W19_25610 [Streptomyces mobaraensis NBRC 13819 = DSM 40847]|nr:hypothetical protein [Streptomyces mobaraensis]QTT76305.1 hypothetical protein J7W19_25610 [Streptomyces mobaraensis NBRC 13819 = DSM 40847]